MLQVGCKNLVFSSSATVYGYPEHCPIGEDAPLSAINPYGRTKLMMEQAIQDISAANPEFNTALLRYFNPAGAHPSGLLGELPRAHPTTWFHSWLRSLLGCVNGCRCSVEIIPLSMEPEYATTSMSWIWLTHMCTRWPTFAAQAGSASEPGHRARILGTGDHRCIRARERKPIPYDIVDQRPGDAAECYADPSLATELLGWHASRDLDLICVDTWRWQQHLEQH